MSDKQIVRTECCVCANKNLEIIYSMKQYPICFTSCDTNSDDFIDLDFAKCPCGIIQLKNLIRPEILYNNSHNNTFNTPTWIEHHNNFASFIKENSNNKDLIEFGGHSGILAKSFISSVNSYTIVDLCDKPPELNGVKFIHGNCETVDIPSESTIIMSHLFEHLYNPRKLLENTKGKVNNFLISIPNMDYALDTENISFMHNEHTFFINDSIIRGLFAEFGYKCAKSFQFKNHSMFYSFIKDIPHILNINPRTDELIQYLKNRESKFSNVVVDNSSFIVPGGHFGQILYYFLRDKSKIIGFLDNDVSKQNKRLYGTPLITYNMQTVTLYKDISILLIKSPYEEEIKKQILEYNPGIKLNVS